VLLVPTLTGVAGTLGALYNGAGAGELARLLRGVYPVSCLANHTAFATSSDWRAGELARLLTGLYPVSCFANHAAFAASSDIAVGCAENAGAAAGAAAGVATEALYNGAGELARLLRGVYPVSCLANHAAFAPSSDWRAGELARLLTGLYPVSCFANHKAFAASSDMAIGCGAATGTAGAAAGALYNGAGELARLLTGLYPVSCLANHAAFAFVSE
jgi:hypothetical protein